jgi:hypothetical protein
VTEHVVGVRDKVIVGTTLAQPEMLPLVASATWRITAGGAPPDGLGGTRSKVVDALSWYAGKAHPTT